MINILPSPIYIVNLKMEYRTNSLTNRCLNTITTRIDNLDPLHCTNCKYNINICLKASCKTCPLYNISHFFRSTITGRVYHIDHAGLSCDTRNVIYLLTCQGCHIQYIGETRQALHKRMTGHRASTKVKIGEIAGNKLISTHYSLFTHCKGRGFKVQVIHKLTGNGLLQDGTVDKNMEKHRKFLEKQYMSELRTVYPFGLNDRFGTIDLFSSANLVNNTINTTNLCFRPLKKLPLFAHSDTYHRPTASISTNKFITEYDIFNFIYNACKCNNKYPCVEVLNYMRTTIEQLNKKIANKFARLITHKLHSVLDDRIPQYFLYACLDTLNNKFTNYNLTYNEPTIHPYYLRIQFTHKIIEDLNLERIINSKSFKILYPVDIKDFKPCITYTYTKTVKRTIFNYTDTFINLDVDTFLDSINSVTCNCSSSPYKDKNHGHVITGDLTLIENIDLRNIIKLGPSHREIPRYSYKYTIGKLTDDINKSIEIWSKRSNLSTAIFEPLRTTLITYVSKQLKSMYTNHITEPVQSLNDPLILHDLLTLQEEFIITPVDKASNNVALTCKWFSIYITLLELGLIPNTTNSTYKLTDYTETNVIDKLISTFPFPNLIDKDKPTLPYIYPLPKLHKDPVKFRFIISSKNTTLKPAQKACTTILRLVHKQHIFYCDLLKSFTGINRMWIINNFQEVINSIEIINTKKLASDTESYDFSTLYTTFEHTGLKSNITWCLVKAYNSHNRMYATFNTIDTKVPCFRPTPSGRYIFDLNQSILLNNFLIDNAYFKIGNKILVQTIGIPIGIDPAPYQANLSLYHDEFIFIEKLCRNKQLSIAKTFNHTHRYIDDINPKNNKENFNKYKAEIYSKGLIINKENIGTQHTSMLEIDMIIKNNTFETKLYDKRDDFKFPIVQYPSLDSNIHSRTMYNVFTTQVIRYSRVCNKLQHLISSITILIKKICKKGCKKYKILILLRKLAFKHNFASKFNFKHTYYDFMIHF